jgi:hypothetical protein
MDNDYKTSGGRIVIVVATCSRGQSVEGASINLRGL